MEARTASPWYVISLRPRGEHGAMRRAAARHGARLVALSPWQLVPRADAAALQDLNAALGASRVVFTSPVAVRAAHQLRARAGRAFADAAAASAWMGVGAGTAAALHRAGVRDAQSPARMDSEGVLALAPLQHVDGIDVGLVTAPGGRDAIAPALRARGARVLRADVYDRVPWPPSSRALAALHDAHGIGVIAASSTGALDQVLATVPADVASRLRRLPVAVASTRMAEHAHALGFERVAVAAGPQPEALLAAAHALASGSMA